MTMTAAQAQSIVGSLGFPSKMPGTAYGIPAQRCPVGALMAKLKGTVCSDCYALKGNYVFASTQASQEKRFASLSDPRWVEAMTALLRRAHGLVDGKVHAKIRAKGANGQGWHRWHDSGDLQSVEHLRKIALVCEATPEITHWLPTREAKTLAAYRAQYGELPQNLTDRLSATKIDGQPSATAPRTSTVRSHGGEVTGERCTAPDRGGVCGPCRACWARDVANVTYEQH